MSDRKRNERECVQKNFFVCVRETETERARNRYRDRQRHIETERQTEKKSLELYIRMSDKETGFLMFAFTKIIGTWSMVL